MINLPTLIKSGNFSYKKYDPRKIKAYLPYGEFSEMIYEGEVYVIKKSYKQLKQVIIDALIYDDDFKKVNLSQIDHQGTGLSSL